MKSANYLAIVGTVFAAHAVARGASSHATNVSPAFFNPSLGQHARMTFQTTTPGELQTLVLDRDRFVIRSFATQKIPAGMTILEWDGKDDRGLVVPNEAYTLRVEFSNPTEKFIYDPGYDAMPEAEEPAPSYGRSNGGITYTLARPARVHIQAGQATTDVGGKSNGPVLKTVVDREPRTSGSIFESWDGYDESHQTYIPDLRHFAIGVFAVSLPPNAIITIGNRQSSFLAYVTAHRRHQRQLMLASHSADHHGGLDAYHDRAPHLTMSLNDCTLALRLTGPSASLFTKSDAALSIFLDEHLIRSTRPSTNPTVVHLNRGFDRAGGHRLTANWSSGRGPVAIATQVLATTTEARK